MWRQGRVEVADLVLLLDLTLHTQEGAQAILATQATVITEITMEEVQASLFLEGTLIIITHQHRWSRLIITVVQLFLFYAASYAVFVAVLVWPKEMGKEISKRALITMRSFTML